MAADWQDEKAIEVPLRALDGTVRALALIDKADADTVLKWRWHLSDRGYVRRDIILPGGRRATLLLHRLILGLEPGDKRQGDHINRNRLDCRRENLRIATNAQNQQNQSGHRGSTSRYRGVTREKNTGLWVARARLNGQLHVMGRFVSEEEAASAAAAFRAEHMPFSEEATV